MARRGAAREGSGLVRFVVRIGQMAKEENRGEERRGEERSPKARICHFAPRLLAESLSESWEAALHLPQCSTNRFNLLSPQGAAVSDVKQRFKIAIL